MAITFGDWNVSLEHQVKELFFPHSNLQPSIVGLSLPRYLSAAGEGQSIFLI